MARERSHHEEWETENQLHASKAQESGDQRSTGRVTHEQPGRLALPEPNPLGDQPADWSDQPTQPQRPIQAGRNWPPQPSDNRPEWPLRTAATGATASPLQRLLDAAHERQFTLGCGTLAALVLIVAAFLAAFSNGWLSGNAGPFGHQPNIQANPAQSTIPMPTITPRPSPTATPVPTDTPVPTVTPYPTVTPFPTVTPMPTATALPTETPAPTQEPTLTPTPPHATATPAPKITPAPTATATK